jgi:hypothetical protein
MSSVANKNIGSEISVNARRARDNETAARAFVTHSRFLFRFAAKGKFYWSAVTPFNPVQPQLHSNEREAKNGEAWLNVPDNFFSHPNGQSISNCDNKACENLKINHLLFHFGTLII